MSDPSPDTPNVCPTCRSTQPAARHTGRWWRLTDGTVDDSRHGPCPDEWHACPAAGSSPPDYTVLAEQLRAVKHYESEDCWYSCPESEEGCCNDGRTGCDCHAPTMWAAADALEAQAARITELETALRPFLRLMEPDGGWHVLDDDVLEIDDSTALAPGEADAIRAQLDTPHQESL